MNPSILVSVVLFAAQIVMYVVWRRSYSKKDVEMLMHARYCVDRVKWLYRPPCTSPDPDRWWVSRWNAQEIAILALVNCQTSGIDVKALWDELHES